ncbi:MAG: PAS domain S-box protein, partial [Syntrophales bacterium]|nr:PAS domain S-box protein [Syntrophales bacterium]
MEDEKKTKEQLIEELGELRLQLAEAENRADSEHELMVDEAVPESDERFGRLFADSADASLILDGTRFVDCNRAALAMLHINSKDQVLNAHPSELSPERQPDGTLSMEKADEMIRRAFVNGSNKFEWVHLRADGEELHVEVMLTPIYHRDKSLLLVVWRDITDRKRVEEALRESEELYKNFVEKSFAGVYVVQDGLFVFLNNNAASFAGYKPEELIGKRAGSVIHPEDREKTRERAEKMFTGEDPSPYEFRVVTKDGEIRWIIETITSIQYDGRKAFLGNSMDITERKRAEEALLASQELEKSILLSVPLALFG